MSRTISVPVYAQVKPKIDQRFRNGQYEDYVEDATIVAVTKSRPKVPRGTNVFLVKLTLRIPDSAFLPFVPEAVISIPENEFEPIVVVDAEDPREQL